MALILLCCWVHTKMGWNVLKRNVFFRKWVFIQKKIFTFYAELLAQCFLEVIPGCMPSALSYPPLIWKEAYWCYFSVLVFLLPSPRKFFCQRPWSRAQSLRANEKEQLSMRIIKNLWIKNSQLQSNVYCFLFLI